MVLLMEGIDRLRSLRARSEQRKRQMREEVNGEFRAKLLEEFREDIDRIVRRRLERYASDPDNPPTRKRQDRPPVNGASIDALIEESARRIVREELQRLDITPGIALRPPAAPPTNAALNEGIIRSVVIECLRQLGIKPGQPPAMPADG